MGETATKRFLPLFHLLLLLPATAFVGVYSSSNDFIKQSCAGTQYPNLCYSSLAPYASAVRQSPAKLSVAAANVSLAKIKDALSLAVSIKRGSGGRIGAALHDCVQSLRTAADLTKQAAAEMGKLGAESKDGGIAWDASNAQTWMSAAMTNEETCLNGFEDARVVSGAKAMCDRVGEVKKYTSNALSLLNTLVNGGY
ncbi:hypothetical protein KSP39_PZI009998 [Platanthera zijinensis]|uniref:Pectinesterase inhibitor domain-containing protein n=1 Tax=Platanthera zijinensis TaxID=2320716 RepID=A0AAP0BHW1_9ASPA